MYEHILKQNKWKLRISFIFIIICESVKSQNAIVALLYDIIVKLIQINKNKIKIPT